MQGSLCGATSAARPPSRCPVPMMNVINGGVHAQNSIDLQEFMVVPSAPTRSPRALRIGAEVYHSLKKVLTDRGLSTGVGDEGGFAPDLESSEAAIEAILEAAGRAGHLDRVAIALDPATSEVFSDGVYRFEGREKTSAEMPGFWAELVDRYPIVSIEDGVAEDDWASWATLTRRLGARVQLVGDDLFVTNPERLQRGIDERGRELDPRQGEPDRDAHRDDRGGAARPGERLHGRDVAPLRRDGGRDDRGSRGRARHRSDQDGRAGALGPGREVQPAAADRRGARRAGRSTPAGARFREHNTLKHRTPD